MKNIVLTLLLAALGTTLFAQEKATPNKEFTLELSASTLEAKPGETKSVEITLNRSKAYSKSNARLGLSSGLPAGVTVEFEPAEGVISSSVARITVGNDVKQGSYTIILKGDIQNKTKGKTLKLLVSENANTVTLN